MQETPANPTHGLGATLFHCASAGIPNSKQVPNPRHFRFPRIRKRGTDPGYNWHTLPGGRGRGRAQKVNSSPLPLPPLCLCPLSLLPGVHGRGGTGLRFWGGCVGGAECSVEARWVAVRQRRAARAKGSVRTGGLRLRAPWIEAGTSPGIRDSAQRCPAGGKGGSGEAGGPQHPVLSSRPQASGRGGPLCLTC